MRDMKKPIMFSVIIPVFNVEEYLLQCVESVLCQTYPHYEIILINDGSTDMSGSICDDLKFRDKRIRVFHQENMGLSEARNSGINMSKGEYILFLDSDDYWDNSMFLERLALHIEEHPVDVVNFNFKKRINNNYTKPYFRVKCMEADEEYVNRHEIWIACAWNKAIKTSLVLSNEIFFLSNATAEDVIWCAELLYCASSWSFFNICAVVYRRREGSISNTVNNIKIDWLLKHIINIGSSLESVIDNTTKAIMIQKYLAYQIGAFLTNIWHIKELKTRKKYFSAIDPWIYIMRKSHKLKIIGLYYIYLITKPFRFARFYFNHC